MLSVIVRKMKRTAILSSICLLAIVLGSMHLVNALPATTFDLTIAPGSYDGGALPVFGTDTIDVKVESDIPVDIYILKYDQLYLIDTENFTYEKKWEGKTSLNVDYKVENMDTTYYILIINPSETETANVDLEYKLFEEVAADAAKDACCGGTVIVGLVLLAALVAIGIYTKRRN